MELMVSSRSIRTAMILFAFNGILALAALFNMYSVIAQVKISAEIQYSRFLDLYLFIAGIEFLLLMFIMPAITSSSISGERERQTLDLMLTTMMTPGQIVLGKLFSAFQTMALLIVSSLPIISMVFVYGGVSLKDLGTVSYTHLSGWRETGGLPRLSGERSHARLPSFRRCKTVCRNAYSAFPRRQNAGALRP